MLGRRRGDNFEGYPMTIGSVVVDEQTDGQFFVQPYCRTVSGSRMAGGLPTVLSSATGVHELGAAIMRAMQHSTTVVLPNRDMRVDPPDRELLLWLGLKSYAEYARGVRSVGIAALYGERHPDHLLVTPQRQWRPAHRIHAPARTPRHTHRLHACRRRRGSSARAHPRDLTPRRYTARVVRSRRAPTTRHTR